ncbi:MAG: hypothetical protein RLZZ63_849 [Gemmatimonadota bacterium]|jgi:hypothetical protein
MSATKVDGAGAAKLRTLDEALLTLQTLHGMVERMALDVKSHRGAGIFPQQIKRTATPLHGLLKGQFGLIADQVAKLILDAGRGSEMQRVRLLREGVAQTRTAVQQTIDRVKVQHRVTIPIPALDPPVL